MSVKVFNEFIKTYNKDNDDLKRANQELFRHFNELQIALTNKTDQLDIKNLEEYLLSLLDELKLTLKNKYIEKFEVLKHFKLYEAQFKNVFEIITKTKDNEGNNWLLAKKPLSNGYMCASCENFLGELNNKTEYIAWNKYPSGGNNGKEGTSADAYGNFRAGSGFSRILSMVNLSSNKEAIDSKDGKNSESHGGNSVNKRKMSDKILPKLNVKPFPSLGKSIHSGWPNSLPMKLR